MKVEKCGTYHAKVEGFATRSDAGRQIPIKVYFLAHRGS